MLLAAASKASQIEVAGAPAGLQPCNGILNCDMHLIVCGKAHAVPSGRASFVVSMANATTMIYQSLPTAFTLAGSQPT